MRNNVQYQTVYIFAELFFLGTLPAINSVLNRSDFVLKGEKYNTKEKRQLDNIVNSKQKSVTLSCGQCKKLQNKAIKYCTVDLSIWAYLCSIK